MKLLAQMAFFHRKLFFDLPSVFRWLRRPFRTFCAWLAWPQVRPLSLWPPPSGNCALRPQPWSDGPRRWWPLPCRHLWAPRSWSLSTSNACRKFLAGLAVASSSCRRCRWRRVCCWACRKCLWPDCPSGWCSSCPRAVATLLGHGMLVMMTGQPHPQAALTQKAQAHLVDLEGLLADLSYILIL